jgi:hypothetical protein
MGGQNYVHIGIEYVNTEVSFSRCILLFAVSFSVGIFPYGLPFLAYFPFVENGVKRACGITMKFKYVCLAKSLSTFRTIEQFL